MRGCTHPPFVGVAARGIRARRRRPDGRNRQVVAIPHGSEDMWNGRREVGTAEPHLCERSVGSVRMSTCGARASESRTSADRPRARCESASRPARPRVVRPTCAPGHSGGSPERRAGSAAVRQHPAVSGLGPRDRRTLAPRPRNPHRRRRDPACAGHAARPPARRGPGDDLQAGRAANRALASGARVAAPPRSLTKPGPGSQRGGTLQSASPGAIAQLGERLDRTQEVAGSSPASSTFILSQIRSLGEGPGGL